MRKFCSPVAGQVRIRGNGWGRSHNVMGHNIRTDTKTGKPRDHQGWDILSAPGSPVYAVTWGTIAWISNSVEEAYGRQILLAFNYKNKDYWAFYGHLQTIEVVEGMYVAEGEQIGTSGQTGNAKGQPLSEAHLHFEIRDSGARHVGSGLSHRLSPTIILGTGPVREIVKDIFPMLPPIAPLPKF